MAVPTFKDDISALDFFLDRFALFQHHTITSELMNQSK